jgi:predicted MFS family arabinose efflux permease
MNSALPASAPATTGPGKPALQGATYAVIILTAMNLLNYVDRYVPSAVKVLFQKDLNLTDEQTSYPLTAFVFVYMIASPIFGSLADRGNRKVLIAIGVALWSVATALAAFATGFVSFLIPRAAVGIGEAAYATISPALISDYFPAYRRNRILTIFYVAIPLGAAIGFTAGGWLGQHYGWRAAFLACGLPGIATAVLVLLMKEPPRGYYDSAPPAAAASWPAALRSLLKNRQYVNAVAGYAAVTFASGALADWFPTFLVRFRGYDVAGASGIAGIGAAVGGLLGTTAGGLLADRLRGKTRQPYLALSAWTMAGATVFAVLALEATSHAVIAFAIITAQTLLWCYNGPINALIVNAVAADTRTRAVSLSIFLIHFLGDASSPSIVGIVSTMTGDLHLAIALVPLALIVGTAIWLYGWRSVPELEGGT